MSNLMRWDPLRELSNLRDNMNRILEEGLATVSGTTIAVDIYETEDMVVIETNPLPGIKPEEIEVSITGNVLTIKGETQDQKTLQSEEQTYLRKERRFGSFTRAITIPRPVKAEDAVASFRDGMLSISIPKAEDARPKVINIEATDE